MNQDLIIISAIFILGIGAIFIYLKKRLDKIHSSSLEENLNFLNQNIQNVEQNLSLQVSRLYESLGNLTEIGRGIKSFSELLSVPKFRGNIGEEVLRNLLEQYFAKDLYSLQYTFKSGERVDAILKTKEGIIPIDAKFPLENFQKWVKAQTEEEKSKHFKVFINDVKKHISKISKKYILPEEGTVDFAIMYIPSEAIYYEIIQSGGDIIEYAREQNVYFTSPNSFYYFLKIIMASMQGAKIQEQAKEILKLLEGIRKDSQKFADYLRLVNTHFNNARNALEQANNEYKSLTLKIEQTKMLKGKK